MTVFKTFLNIIKMYKGTIILYTVILVLFSAGNMTTSDNNINFVNSKPDVFIVNEDNDNLVTNNLIKFIEDNSKIKNIKNNEDAINDAIFYRDVNYVIYIPKNYSKDVMNNLNPKIDIKSTGDYQASLANMMLTRYIRTQNIYKQMTNNEQELVELINNNLSKTSTIEMTTKLDTDKLNQTTFYFNFASYSILAVIILIICMVLNSFNHIDIHKRTVISSMNYKKYNGYILLGSFVYCILIWILYILLARIIVGNIIFTSRGLIYIFNLLLYAFCSLTIAMLISTVVNNKNAINGVVNVVALGSAFLCGAFIPVNLLPSSVLKIAHILPAYWYINSNEVLSKIEILNLQSLKPIILNSIIIIAFSIFYIIINNIITKKKLVK